MKKKMSKHLSLLPGCHTGFPNEQSPNEQSNAKKREAKQAV